MSEWGERKRCESGAREKLRGGTREVGVSMWGERVGERGLCE